MGSHGSLQSQWSRAKFGKELLKNCVIRCVILRCYDPIPIQNTCDSNDFLTGFLTLCKCTSSTSHHNYQNSLFRQSAGPTQSQHTRDCRPQAWTAEFVTFVNKFVNNFLVKKSLARFNLTSLTSLVWSVGSLKCDHFSLTASSVIGLVQSDQFILTSCEPHRKAFPCRFFVDYERPFYILCV